MEFSLPAIAGMLVTALYNVVDRIFVGNWVGSDGIAAVSICFPVMLIMMAFGMLIAFGGTSLVAIRLGQGRRQEAEQVLGNALTLYLLLAASFTSFGLLFMSPLLRLFGASGTVLPLAEEYLTIILLGVLVHEISFGMSNFIRSDGNPHAAMLTMLLGAGINLLLDPLFIVVLHWGIRGAALATVLAQSISAAWVMTYFLGGKSALKLRAANLRLRPGLVRQIAVAGTPPWVMALAASAIQAILNNRLQLYGGELAVTVMGIIFSIYALVKMPIAGISQGAQPIIGYNYGTLRFGRVRQTLLLAIIAATVFVVLCFAAVELQSARLIRLFNPNDRELARMGSQAIRIFLSMLPLVGFQMVSANYFQAVGKPRVATLLTLSRQVLLLMPLVLILPHFFGLTGIWLAAPVAELVAALLSGIFLIRELRRLGVNPARAKICPRQTSQP